MAESDDPKRLVAAAYDEIAEAYLARYGESAARARWAGELIRRLPAGGRVLDLGCGAGVPLARGLVAAGFEVTGVDASRRQIELARKNAPGARFVQADMVEVGFAAGAFDGLACFYALNHLPRETYAGLLASMRQWLAPGGVLVANFGAADDPGWTGEWLGARTFFSGFPPERVLELVAEAGFAVESSAVEVDPEDDGRFLWIVARA